MLVLSLPIQTWVLGAADSYAHYATLPVGLLLTAGLVELFHRFGVLPGSGDHHVAEFFPGFVTPENDYGSGWKVHIYGLRKHMADADDDVTHYESVRDSDEVSRFPSGELVAPLLEAIVTGRPRDLPVNLPNRGQVSNLPDDVVVEAMGTIDAGGVRARDQVQVPSVLGEYLRRVAVSLPRAGRYRPGVPAKACDPGSPCSRRHMSGWRLLYWRQCD